MRCFPGILICLLVATISHAQGLQMSGYVKALAISSRLPTSGTSFLLNLNRGRTEVNLSVHENVHLEAWLDTEIRTGSFLRTNEYQLSRKVPRPRPLDLDWTLLQNTSIEITQQLFRAYATVETGRVQWRIGRQRIAWGMGFAWNPTDLLNPFNPGAIELGERSGIDALYADIALGPLSKAELVVAVPEKWSERRYAVRAGANVAEYDVSLMAGLFGPRKAIGGDFAGYLGDAGLRGELAWIHSADNPAYLRAVLNADYTFRPGIYALTEIYYNGHRSLEPMEVFGQGQWYAAFTLSAPVTPLIGISAYGLVNMTDGSALSGPGVSVSLAQQLELLVAAYLFTGADDTEFGTQRHAAFATLQWYY